MEEGGKTSLSVGFVCGINDGGRLVGVLVKVLNICRLGMGVLHAGYLMLTEFRPKIIMFKMPLRRLGVIKSSGVPGEK